ncbi:MAG: hypothetical protein AB7O49_06820 [Sphingomonadales bacterium]
MNPIVDQFLACRKPADFYRLQILLECDAAPGEIASAFGQESLLPREAADWLAHARRMMFVQSARVQPYGRRRIAPHVALYPGRRGEGEPRELLVAFCGLADRLQVPVPVVLQHLDARRYDVLLLRDPTKRIYLQGVPDYAPDLAQVAERIRRDLDLSGYHAIQTFGTSGGGWAAFTVGTLLGAERAISMSGRPPGATFRLARMWERRGYSLDEQDADFTVFERLFNQAPVRSTKLFNFFGADCETDLEGAEAFERTVGAVAIGFRGVDHHNLMLELLKSARLGKFLHRYLAGDQGDIVPLPGERILDLAVLDDPPAAAG